MKNRTTLYDLLGLPPTATEGDIHAAHLRLVRHYQSGQHGLSQDDADNRIKAIKEAWWTLSDSTRRAAYDAGLAPTQPEPTADPQLATAIAGGPLPVEVEIKALKQRSPLRIMLTIIGGLMIVGMVVQILMSVFAFRQVSRIDSGEAMSAAQARVAAAERRQTYGDTSDAEIAAQEAEARRRQDTWRETQAERQAEQARRNAELQHERELAERKRYADQVSSDLQRAEDEARYKADRERKQQEAREQYEEAQEQARTERRLARERARLGLSGNGN